MDNYLPKSFYQRAGVVQIARELLGKQLFTLVDGQRTGGTIVEVEAYCGASDSACHAFPNKKTARTEVMYQPGGIAYVYLIYGRYNMFNVVTNTAGSADAVLIRAIEPHTGLELIKRRRGQNMVDQRLTGGPARLAQALGIELAMNAFSLHGDSIWIEQGMPVATKDVAVSGRIGVENAGSGALLPWRFFLSGNPFVSRLK